MAEKDGVDRQGEFLDVQLLDVLSLDNHACQDRIGVRLSL